MKTKFILKRGDIIYVDFGKTIDSIQGGKRPCIVVANDLCNKYSPNIQVVPLTTSKSKKVLPTHVTILEDCKNNLTTNSTALCEAVTIISTSQILENIGKLSEDKMKEVDNALQIQLNLKKPDISRIKNMVITIKELENYIIRQKEKSNDLIKILKLQINDFISYCNDFGVNYNNYYTSKFTVINDFLQKKAI